MALYMTKQRKALLDFLCTHPHESFSAAQISHHFENEISTSAVYRNLSELEYEGHIRKIVKHGIRETFFQYIHAQACANKIHLICQKCEKTVHLSAEAALSIQCSLASTEGFAIDPNNTVIYGICKDCQ